MCNHRSTGTVSELYALMQREHRLSDVDFRNSEVIGPLDFSKGREAGWKEAVFFVRDYLKRQKK